MSNLPDELRAIADRLEAADAERDAALNELAGLAHQRAGQNASALVADEAVAEDAPTSVASRAPLEEGPAGADVVATSVGEPAPTLPSARSLLPAKDRAALRPKPAPAKEQLPCPDCDRSFASPSALGVHRRHRHGHRAPAAGLRATCVSCGADVRADGLARHQRDAHPEPGPVLKHGEEWFLCDRCPERFRTAEARAEHRASHRAAPRGQPVGRPSLNATAIAGRLGS